MEKSQFDIEFELTEEAYKRRDKIQLVIHANEVGHMDSSNPMVMFYCGTAMLWVDFDKDTEEAVKNASNFWSKAIELSIETETNDEIRELINSELSRVYSDSVIETMAQVIINYKNQAHIEAHTEKCRKSFERFGLYVLHLVFQLRSAQTDAFCGEKDEDCVTNEFPFPYISLKDWETVYTRFQPLYYALANIGVRSPEFMVTLYGLIQAQIAIDTSINFALSVRDRIPAIQICLKTLENGRRIINERFGDNEYDGLITIATDLLNSELDECKTFINWLDHPEEKEALEAEKESLEAKMDSFAEDIKNKSDAFAAIKAEMEQKTEEEILFENEQKKIDVMKSELAGLGIFKGKQKKELAARIANAEQEIKPVQEAANASRDKRNAEYGERVQNAKNSMNAAKKEKKDAQNRIKEIEEKLDINVFSA